MVANKPKMTRPSLYQFKLGDFTITNVLEGYIHREDMHPFTAKNVEAAEVEAVAADYRLPYPKLEHNFVPSLVDTGDKLIALDPGFGEKAHAPTTGWLNGLLPEAGYTLEDVDIVVVTHCHPDHIGNLMADGKPTFPNAEIVFGAVEFDFWRKGENIPDFRPPTLAMFREVAEPNGRTGPLRQSGRRYRYRRDRGRRIRPLRRTHGLLHRKPRPRADDHVGHGGPLCGLAAASRMAFLHGRQSGDCGHLAPGAC